MHHTGVSLDPETRATDLNGVLSVEYIVDAVPPADLYWIYLVQVKVGGSALDMVL